LSNHPSQVIMYDTLREHVWWPSMLSEICAYVKSCPDCLVVKTKKVRVPVQPVNLPKGPWTDIAVDFIGPLPETDKGNKYILTVVDVLTRSAESIPIQDCDTQTIAEAIISHVICRHGLFEMMRSDRGPQFVGIIAANVYKQLGIKQIKTTAWHPQSNGIVERFNKTLKQTLKLWSNEYQNDWDTLLPYAMFAYMTTYHSTLQETPFYVLYGRDPSTILTRTLGNRPEKSADIHDYATSLAQRLYDVHTRVLEIYRKVNDDRIESGCNDVPTFSIGQKVYLYYPVVKQYRDPATAEKKRLNAKLSKRWIGPYTVLEQLTKITYRIEKEGKVQDVHVERLRDAVSHTSSTLTENQYDLTLAEAEMESIKATQQALLERQSELQQEKSKLEAEIQLSAQSDQIVNVNATCVYIIDDYTHRLSIRN